MESENVIIYCEIHPAQLKLRAPLASSTFAVAVLLGRGVRSARQWGGTRPHLPHTVSRGHLSPPPAVPLPWYSVSSMLGLVRLNQLCPCGIHPHAANSSMS